MFERFTSRARSVLVYAQEEARQLQHDFIGTEHLVLGVIECGDAAVTHFMSGYDFTIDDLRARITELIGPSGGEVTGPPPFTPRAKKVLELSLREALSMGHHDIGPAHILLGILREGEGVGANLLVSLGVDYDRARLWVGQELGVREPVRGRRGRRARMRDIGRWDYEAGTRPVVKMHARACALGTPELVGTHHYLLALLDEPDSMAAKVLESVGVTKEQVEAKVAEIGIENTSDAPPKRVAQPQTVKLAEGVEVRISDPDLSKLVESGDLESLLKEVIRRAKPDA